MDMERIRELFFQEAEDLLNQYETALLELDKRKNIQDNINGLFRSIHTFKSSTALVGWENLSDFCHHFENLLDSLRSQQIAVSDEIIALLFSVGDILKSSIESNLQIPTPQFHKMMETLQHQALKLMKTDIKPPAAASPELKTKQEKTDVKPGQFYQIHLQLDSKLFETGTDPINFFYELMEFGDITEIQADCSRIPEFEKFDCYSLYIRWIIHFTTKEPRSRIENVFIFVMDDSNSIRIESPETGGSETETPLPSQPPFKKSPEQKIAPLSQNKTQPQEVLSPPVKRQPVQQEKSPVKEPAMIIKKAATSATPTTDDKKPVSKVSTIRVDTEKLDKLVNLVSEMVIGVARLNQIATSGQYIKNRDLRGTMENLVRFSRDLQEQVMRVRMIPVEGTFNRFYRVVRDLARELNKKIRIEMYGIETELDKNVIEQLGDPLKHLIRNSVDHGIESPETRRKKGKPDEGVIKLKAYQQEGSIIIEISDDGAGINREIVYKKALERGLISPQEAFTDQEIFNFLFLPGFSTAQKVTEISGRGVGLDVVRRNIEDLKGSIMTESTPDMGTTFRIKLPLTLAIIDGMIVRVGKEHITIPLLSIIESIRPQADDIKSLEKEGELIEVRGEYLPLVRLHKLFSFDTDKIDPTEALVVIIEGNRKKFGLLVDDIIGEQQAVIKSLEKNLKQIEGTAGATILGDGSLSLILDIYGIEKMAFSKQGGVTNAG